MNNDIFSFSRFSMYVATFYGENRKKLLQTALSIVGVMIFFAAIIPIMKGTYAVPSTYDRMWSREISLFWIFLFMFAFVGAAGTFISFVSKEKRIYSLTFPASNLEKFLTYILFFVIGIYVIFFIGYFVGDYLRVWTAPLYADSEATIEPMPLLYFLSFGDIYYNDGHYDYDSESVYIMRFMVFSSLLFLQALFVLFASIWPKHAKQRGLISIVGINFGLGFIFYLGMKIVLEMYGIHFIFRWEDTLQDIGLNTVLAWGYSMTFVIVTGLYLLSYKRFKEMETIERW